MKNNNRILTTKEVAVYIKMNEKTVLKMAQEGRLPGVKIGAQWRFHLDTIEAYFQNHLKSEIPNQHLLADHHPELIPLSRLIKENLMELDVTAQNADDVLGELVKIAWDAKLTSSRTKLFAELKEREEMLSTAIGQGIAIPHPRHPNSELFLNTNIILARVKKGIDFKAPDKNPVHLFFMICAPNELVHLRLLAHISKFLLEPNMIQRLLDAGTKQQIIKILLEFERNCLAQKLKTSLN